MSTFQRETRYITLKFSDVQKLCTKDINELLRICTAVDAVRAERGKGPLATVVVESDWPEYESVWAEIQKNVLST